MKGKITEISTNDIVNLRKINRARKCKKGDELAHSRVVNVLKEGDSFGEIALRH